MSARDDRSSLAADVTAFDTMTAARPKRPPPYRFDSRPPNAARVEARKARERETPFALGRKDRP